ncbi:2-keto-4-pentenoate hydratase/2-oxohepta-3-ene-1,7-dioic acid hydratase in catechol pathway/regulator of RNase E activity RraA [Streptosporangium becharense]|uniref:2-keto-4-pentenoate hydratase/2-oxohepta-3-ene-1,7-dioic acid hydratase in catechol pathway/regulator of RNase E activity RraA n=1 Tax=Streptosporangium becharense TaxID=1816182 RepID=A0A7W9IN84_9ACTN|nr:fumarylacetoacetate hydrolase family protein [Streptosporangium becharense]MBB2910495.1 2-keto-4-pentenoate hydratase/2-oxohepta-3-ene-1,7-dioic acid hydratase in catechol pathway/regulator of RNase E activity RraA [Streptosporangium becharense]MBB5823238.1 2-keto-4-pentenoate hydratase/2-oxohepta-3-ene-1,7-dioic acid hydratase in catechol pathway/regulator of RNase E activity RraA [Streptosporangium becharense]
MTHPLGLAPSKIIAVHLNYRSRAEERGRFPEAPSYFLKPPSSLSHSGAPVVRPRGCEYLAFEGEIAVVVGRRAHRVSVAEALDHVAGYAAANDFGVYDLRHADRGSNVRSKGCDGFTPVGPLLLDAREVDPGRLTLRTWVNGELVQEASTEELLFPFAVLVADLSRLMTLEAGDVILAGTPAGSTVVRPGDVVEVELEDSGRLRNEIVEAGHDLEPIGAMPRASAADREAALGGRAAPATAPVTGAAPDRDSGAAPDRDSATATGPAPATATAAVSGPAPATAPVTAAASGPVRPAVTEETLAALRTVSTATISSVLRKKGVEHHFIEGVRPARPDLRMVGFARTLRYVPLREDVFAEIGGGMNAQKRTVEEIQPGEVLVIEARGDHGAGTLGDILALRALRRGAAGVVTDGGLRDSPSFASLDLPSYYGVPHAAVLGRRHVPLEGNVPVACGGVLVMPGDLLVGDAEGVVVVPPALAAEVAAEAVEQERQERFIYERVAAGESVDGLYPIGPRWREAYEAWAETRPVSG